MEPVVSLIDLPKSWMFLLSTKLTAETAARARCTCKLLQKVIDATWEPELVPIPPHRRSVPLTLEQVQAQMPPQVERHRRSSSGSNSSSSSSDWDGDDSDDDDEDLRWDEDEFGRTKRMVSAFGPALTRLTANQALNTLQGKTMLCWLFSHPGTSLCRISNCYTLQERLCHLKEVVFKDNPETWPPEDRGDLLGFQLPPFNFFGEYQTQKAFLNPGIARWEDPGPHQVYTSVADVSMFCVLRHTTNSSCREASKEEQQQFLESPAASHADDFDMFLSYGRDCAAFYVFLEPTRRHFTGRLKDTAAEQLLSLL